MTKQLYRSLRVALLLALLLAGCAAPTATPEPITLKLSWQHGAQFLGFYVAQSRGYYATEGLAVTIEPLLDTTEVSGVHERVVAGELDFGIGGRDLLLAQAQGVPVAAVATIYQFGPHAFFARADSGIVTPADLAGRRVVVKAPVWREFLESLLKRGGLTLADVEEVPGGFDMTPFVEGEVEVWAGYLNNEVVRARLQGLELVTLPVYEYGIRTNALTIYTSQAMLEANPGQAVRFLRASLRGWQWAVENPTEAVDTMLELFPDMAAERDFHLASFDASIPLIHPPGVRLGTIDCAYWVAHELLADLESTVGLCATTILEAAWEGE